MNIIGLMLVVPLAACDPEPVRGPASEPVERIEASRLRFDAALGRAAAPVSVVPLLADTGAQPAPVPAPVQLRDALAAVAPDGVAVAMVATPRAEPDHASEPPLAIVATIDLAAYQPVLVAAQTGTDGVALLTADGADVVLGSAFVAEFSPLQPLGLLQVDGALRSELQPYGYTRVLGFSEGQVGVVGRGNFHRGLFESALQVGPGIIEQGRLDISERELKLPAFFRTFLMHCGERVVVGASTRPIHLRTLGIALLDFAAERGLQCDEAVNLSGDREALLGIRSATEAVVLGNPRVKKTALIGFRARPL
ncbi:MAG: hypothetical protein AB8B93_06150 [Pseudomonadales bacterium]